MSRLAVNGRVTEVTIGSAPELGGCRKEDGSFIQERLASGYGDGHDLNSTTTGSQRMSTGVKYASVLFRSIQVVHGSIFKPKF